MRLRFALATPPIEIVCLPAYRERISIAPRSARTPTHKLHLQQLLELQLDCDHTDSHRRRADLKHADLVRADRKADLVELAWRKLVDREEDPAVVERLGRVLVRAELVLLALLLKFALVGGLEGPREDEPLLAAEKVSGQRWQA